MRRDSREYTEALAPLPLRSVLIYFICYDSRSQHLVVVFAVIPCPNTNDNVIPSRLGLQFDLSNSRGAKNTEPIQYVAG